MITQDYKIELIVKADAENSPKDWLKNAQKYGGFPFGECLLTAATPTITKVYSYSVEAIDSSHLDYKFMSDMDKLQSLNDKASKEDRESQNGCR